SVSATVEEDGTFALEGLPSGTRTLEVRAIGFVVRQVPVDLAPGRVAKVDVRMDRTAQTLGAVTVYGTPTQRTPLLNDFLQRRRNRSRASSSIPTRRSRRRSISAGD